MWQKTETKIWKNALFRMALYSNFLFEFLWEEVFWENLDYNESTYFWVKTVGFGISGKIWRKRNEISFPFSGINVKKQKMGPEFQKIEHGKPEKPNPKKNLRRFCNSSCLFIHLINWLTSGQKKTLKTNESSRGFSDLVSKYFWQNFVKII